MADDYQTTIIPEPTFETCGITAQWIGINKIGVNTYKKPTQTEDVASELSPCEARVYHLRTDSILFDPIIRKLVNESNGTFVNGQKVSLNPGGQPETLKLSRQYRSVLRACIEDLQNESKKPQKEFYQQYVAIFYNIEFIWHLTEILFVNPMPGDVVLPHLLEWVRFHFPDGELGAARMLGGVLEPGAEVRHVADYWPTIIALVLQGSLEPARALLRLHTDADTQPFVEAEQMLKTLPEYNVFGGLSVSEFNTRFQSWQAKLISKLESGIFNTCKDLQLIMKMIAGEATAEMRQHCGTWYQLMVATLLYAEPTVKSFDLTYHANKCIMLYGGAGQLKLLDNIVVALIECNLHDVIKKLQNTCDSGWAAAHLTNLLFHCGRLNLIDPKTLRGLPEHMDERLVADYGELLMGHRSLWQAGIAYLDHCPRLGRARLQLLMPRVPPDTEARANKIVQMALQRNMPDIAASVCKVMGVRNARRGRLGAALSWALRSQDAGFASHLADRVLERYAKEGVFDSIDLLDNLGSSMLVCDRLTFLGKYCEFHKIYRSGDFKKAAELLMSLIRSRISPKYFWLTLLTDALPLLEADPGPVFAYRDACELIDCLEELMIDCHDSPGAPPVPDDRNRLIRMAINKNLVRASVKENAPRL